MSRNNCVIVGSGNIGTDRMYKVLESSNIDLVAMVGIDPKSDGLAMAREAGVATTSDGVDWLLGEAANLGSPLVFEATSAHVHRKNAPLYKDAGLVAVDLTPAKLGPRVVPSVNLHEHLSAPNVNLITCGGQATIPIVHAAARTCDVKYAETISSISSVSAGIGTRQNIDEFTHTTSQSLAEIGGATHGKAIMILNPADPPILMRNTVYCSVPDDVDEHALKSSLAEMVAEVATFVPGYRLMAEPVIERGDFNTPAGKSSARLIVLLEVEGAGHYLPPYAGNLDIMTAAAVRVGEALLTSKE